MCARRSVSRCVHSGVLAGVCSQVCSQVCAHRCVRSAKEKHSFQASASGPPQRCRNDCKPPALLPQKLDLRQRGHKPCGPIQPPGSFCTNSVSTNREFFLLTGFLKATSLPKELGCLPAGLPWRNPEDAAPGPSAPEGCWDGHSAGPHVRAASLGHGQDPGRGGGCTPQVFYGQQSQSRERDERRVRPGRAALR